jgi:hypothetical protein
MHNLKKTNSPDTSEIKCTYKEITATPNIPSGPRAKEDVEDD